MNDLEFEFGESLLGQYLDSLYENDAVSASELLALLEGEDEESVEETFYRLQDLTVCLNLEDLPRPVFAGESGLRLKWERELAQAGNLLQKLEKNDPLYVYLSEVAAIPVCGDICRIAEELGAAHLRGEENEDLRLALVNLSLSRVVELSLEYTGWGVFLLDLIQEGSLGLWQATASFAGKGVDFENTRDWWIKFYLGKAVIMQARENGLGQRMRIAMEDYRAVDEQLLAELGRNPTVEEMAEGLHLTVEATATVKKMLDNARLLAQAKKQPEPEEDEIAETQAVEDTAYFRMRQRIQDLLAELNPTDAKLLTLRYGLEGGLPLSPEDTGRKLGLTPDEVIMREANALMKLRNI